MNRSFYDLIQLCGFQSPACVNRYPKTEKFINYSDYKHDNLITNETWIDYPTIVPHPKLPVFSIPDLHLMLSRPYRRHDLNRDNMFASVTSFYFIVVQKSVQSDPLVCQFHFLTTHHIPVVSKLLWLLLVLWDPELRTYYETHPVEFIPVESFFPLLHVLPSKWIPSWVYRCNEYNAVCKTIDLPVFVTCPLMKSMVNYPALSRHWISIWPKYKEETNKTYSITGSDIRVRDIPPIKRNQYYALILFVIIPVVNDCVTQYKSQLPHWTTVLKTCISAIIQDKSLTSMLSSDLFVGLINNRLQTSRHISVVTIMHNLIERCRTLMNTPISIDQKLIGHAAHVQFGRGTHINEVFQTPNGPSNHSLHEVHIPTMRQHLLDTCDFVSLNQMNAFMDRHHNSNAVKAYFVKDTYAMLVESHLSQYNRQSFMVLDTVHYNESHPPGVLLLLNTGEAWVQTILNRRYRMNPETERYESTANDELNLLAFVLAGCIDPTGTYDIEKTAIRSYHNVLRVLYSVMEKPDITCMKRVKFMMQSIQFYVMQVVLDPRFIDSGIANRVHEDVLFHLMNMDGDIYMHVDNVEMLTNYSKQFQTGCLMKRVMFPDPDTDHNGEDIRQYVDDRIPFHTKPFTPLTNQYVKVSDRQLETFMEWIEFVFDEEDFDPVQEKWFAYAWLSSVVVAPRDSFSERKWDVLNARYDETSPNMAAWDPIYVSDVANKPSPVKLELRSVNADIPSDRNTNDMFALIIAIHIMTRAWTCSDLHQSSENASQCLAWLKERRVFNPVQPFTIECLEMDRTCVNPDVALHPLLISWIACEDNGLVMDDTEPDTNKYELACNRLCAVSPPPPPQPVPKKRKRDAKPVQELFLDVSSSSSDDDSDEGEDVPPAAIVRQVITTPVAVCERPVSVSWRS